MRRFERYLKEKGFAKSTVCQYARYTTEFLSWLGKEQLTVGATTYNDLLSYIERLRKQNNSTSLINRKLLAVRHYFSFFQLRDKSIANPAADLHIRGHRRRMVSGILPYEQLEGLYRYYKVVNDHTLRNKVILGMLVYQGVTTEELHKLQISDINLREGKLKVPGGRRSNSRMLHLQALQIVDLQEYIQVVRPKILSEFYQDTPGRKPSAGTRADQTGQLFLSMGGSVILKNTLHHLFRALKKLDSQVQSAKQIRQSVIVYWLKHYNLREVQYMAGHRYVSSTERYQMDHIEDLQKEIIKYHPLG